MTNTCEIRIYTSPAQPEDVESTSVDYVADLTLVGWRPVETCTLEIDSSELLALEADTGAYGMALGRVLFADHTLGKAYRESIVATEARGEDIRIRLRIDPPELQALHWERLQAPRPREWAPLGITAATPFSRYVLSEQWDKPEPVAGPPFRLLVVIASPSDLTDYKLDAIERSEIESLHNSLDKLGEVVEVTYLESGLEDAAPTVVRLQEELNGGHHLVVCQGSYSRSVCQTIIMW